MNTTETATNRLIVKTRPVPNGAGRVVPNAHAPGHGNIRKPVHVAPGGAPKAAGRAASSAAKATVGTAGRVAAKGGLGVAARVLAGRVAMGVGGALGGPVGTVVTTCAFEGGYQVGAALGRRNNPITPAYPGGNRILKKQQNGTFKWVPGPNKPTQKNTPKATRINPMRQLPLSPQEQRQKQANEIRIRNNQKNGITEVSAEAAEVERKTGGKSQQELFNEKIDVQRREKALDAEKVAAEKRQELAQQKSDALGRFNSAVEAAKEARRAWMLGGRKGPIPPMPNPSDFGL